MKQTLKVNVNNNYDFEIDKNELEVIDLVKTAASTYHLLHNNNSYDVVITEEDFLDKSYQITINNNSYSVNIINDLDILIKALGFEIGSSIKVDKIVAPMPGLILELSVSVGDEVNENDPLLILEAMKMENVISSPREGIIKSISVKKGDAVDKNQMLLEFE